MITDKIVCECATAANKYDHIRQSGDCHPLGRRRESTPSMGHGGFSLTVLRRIPVANLKLLVGTSSPGKYFLSLLSRYHFLPINSPMPISIYKTAGKFSIAILFSFPLTATAQFITTVAGNGTYGNTGDGGPATAAEIGYARNVKVDKSGNIYIVFAVEGAIRKIAPTGIITTFAGNGFPGDSGDSGPATAAQIHAPTDVSFDGIGNVFIADAGGRKIRKVNPSGIISTFAGDGTLGSGGDGGLATAAQFSYPNGIAFDNDGNAYVTDGDNNKVRKISPSGIISTFAGTGMASYSGDNGPATAAMLNDPSRVAVDASGNVYIDDYGNNRIRKVNKSGIISLVAGNGSAVFGGDGMPATGAQLSAPVGVDIDGSGNIYIADAGNQRVRKINPAGIISTIAGTGIAGYNGECILATAAELNHPYGVAVGNNGYIYVANYSESRVHVISPSCKLSVDEIPVSTTGVVIHPNPVQDVLSVVTADKITSLTVTNLLGQTIYNNVYSNEDVQVDVTDLPKGMYLVRINGTEVRKFVKQ
jgi:sugar lactone lactonase YvrE